MSCSTQKRTQNIVALDINNRDFWIKVVGMLQQNWALIGKNGDSNAVYFLDDMGKVFDHIDFESVDEAQAALARNGFRLFAEEKKLQEIISSPREPFTYGSHPSGKIYSSGDYWVQGTQRNPHIPYLKLMKKEAPPEFETLYDEVLHLMKNYRYSGGSMAAAGMGYECDDYINEEAPEWAKDLASSLRDTLLYNIEHPTIDHGCYEDVSFWIEEEDSRIYRSMHFGSQDPLERPYTVGNPKAIQNAIKHCLGAKTNCAKHSEETSKLVYEYDEENKAYRCDASEFYLMEENEDGDEDDVECSDEQALSLLDAVTPLLELHQDFEPHPKIGIFFVNLEDDMRYTIEGSTKPQDITDDLKQLSMDDYK